MVYVALLRGINVGGKNKLPMAELVRIFEDAGCKNVETYIQSGNVVFDAPASVAKKLATTIPQAIAKRLGLDVPVVFRTAAELEAVTKKNPFSKKGKPDALHVMFLADAPDAKAVASLDPDRSPGDVFSVLGRDVYLFLPNGAGNTKLSNAWFDSKLATTSTGRNWRTVQKLVEMSSRDS